MTARSPIALACLLAACSPEPAPPAVPVANNVADIAAPAPPAPPAPAPAVEPPTAAGPVLAIDGEGLRLFNPVNGAARPLSFGMPRANVLAALASRGPPELARLEECGAGPLDQAAWADGLRVYFQRGMFVGWALGRSAKAVTTASGIGPGSTRAELEAAYSAKVVKSTLGTEFSAGAIAGLLDGPDQRARITDMWAGASCNFR